MLTEKNVDLVVYNDVGRADIGFDSRRQRGHARHRRRRPTSLAPRSLRSRPRCSTRSSGSWRGADERGRVLEASRAQAAADVAERVVASLATVVHAPAETLRLPLLCLLAQGHVLVEDVPGVGKTVLAKALARTLDLRFSRLQFTPDLLPSDVTGVNVYDQQEARLRVPARARSSPTSCSSTRSTGPRRRPSRRCSRRCRRRRSRSTARPTRSSARS